MTGAKNVTIIRVFLRFIMGIPFPEKTAALSNYAAVFTSYVVISSPLKRLQISARHTRRLPVLRNHP